MKDYGFSRNTGLFFSGTLLSRLLGFIRDVIFAGFFGTSAVFEAFVVAFRIPNLLRSLLGEGFTDSVATPVLSKYAHDKEKLCDITNHLILVLSFVTLVITAAGIVFSAPLVHIIVPGFPAGSYKFFLTVSFTRLSFIYLFFIALSSNLRAFLSSLKKFFLPAFSPCVLNISFIVGVLFFHNLLGGFVLIASVIVGGGIEFLLYWAAAARRGLSFKASLKEAFRDKVIFHMFRLFLPRIWSSVVYQFNVLVDTIFSSLVRFVGEGGVAAVYYANRVIQLPFAMVALSISRVAVVDFSRLHREGRIEEIKKLFVFSLRNILLFVVPATFVLLAVARLLIKVLFFRGAFSGYSLTITSSALFFYAFGLPFFCLIKLLVTVFYSLEDTVTPAKVSTVTLLVNAVLNALLMVPLKIGGIALASSIAAALNFFILYRLFVKRAGKIEWGPVKKEIAVLVFAGIVMSIFSFIAAKLVPGIYTALAFILGGDFVIFYLFVSIFKLNTDRMMGGWLFPYGRK